MFRARTSHGLALAVGNLSIKVVQGHFDVRLALRDGALQMLLDVRQELVGRDIDKEKERERERKYRARERGAIGKTKANEIVV